MAAVLLGREAGPDLPNCPQEHAEKNKHTAHSLLELDQLSPPTANFSSIAAESLEKLAEIDFLSNSFFF